MSNDTYQYKCGGVKAYKKGKGLASGYCPSLKNAAELCMRQRKRHAFLAKRNLFLEFSV